MEALKMGPQMDSWNDDRLDDLSRRTDEGFKEVRGEIKDLSRRTDEGFKEVKSEIKDLSRRTDEGLKKVDERFKQVDERFKEVNQEFKEVRGEIRHSTHTLIGVGGVIVAAIIGSGIFG